MKKKLDARIAKLEELDKESAMLERLINATHDVVNDLIDRIKNPERRSTLLDKIIHKNYVAVNTIIDFLEDETGFSRGYLLSKRSVIAEEASEVAGALAIYSDWEDKGYFDGDGDFDESVNGSINMDKKLEARIARLERMVNRKSAKNESTVTNLHDLAKRLEILLHKKGIKWFDIKAYSDKVDISFNWEDGGGDFFIMPSKNGGYTVDGEYYVEKFDTIQQVVDYLEHEDSKNS